MYLTVARQLLVMAIIVIISFFFSRKNQFGQAASQFLSRLLLYVVNPCMIVSTFDVEFSGQKLKSLGLAIAVSFVFHFVMIAMVSIMFATKRLGKSKSGGPELVPDQNARDCLSKVGIVFTNSGFIGIPLINGVFGGEGVFFLMGYILVFNVLLWVWGEWLMTGAIRPLKIILNPNVLACAAGLAVFCLPFKMPYVVIEPLRMIGACNGAASMILLGLLFSSFDAAGEARSFAKPLARDVFVRLIFCPLVLLGLTLLALQVFAGVQGIKLIMSVLFIAVCCPVGMSVSSFAVVFKKDTGYASVLVAVSSAACVVTIPLLVAFLEALV
ncbi:MAG: AEC family transporter [Treponema sp.]|nr:AEC family transporter [Treponema sp.]